MGFFYQAIKRATGQPAEEPEQEAKSVLAQMEAAGTATAVATPVATSLVPPSITIEKVRRAAKQMMALKHPIDKLVAFLTPPVLDPNIIAMEQCRVLRTKLWEVIRARKAKTVLITSAIPEEGKTVLAVNLAFALSQLEGTRVLLVDADLRKPSVANFLRMSPPKGLCSYLQDNEPLENITWQLSPSLDVVPTMVLTKDSAELLHGSRMQAFLREVCELYDIVVFDAAPLLPVADTQVLAPLLDGAVLAIRAHSTPAEMVKQCADLLGSKLLGTVLNGAKRPAQNRYYTGYLGKNAKR